jgi:hypothetical protein
MATVSGSKNPISHLPLTAVTSTVQIPTVAGNAGGARILNTPAAGLRTLTIAGANVSIDLSQHTAANIIDIINGKNIAGVTASLDRYGQLVITGASQVTGDALLLQHLGFA